MKLQFSNKLMKQTFIYTVSDCISKGFSFLILPFLSYYISPEQMGIVSNFEVLQNILTLLAGIVMVNGIPYFYYGKTKEERAELISNLIFLNIFIFFLLFLISLIFQSYLIQILNLNKPIFLLSYIIVPVNLVTSASSILFRLEEKPLKFATYNLSFVLLQAILLLILVMYFKWEALGKVLSTVIASFILSIFHLVSLYKREYLIFKMKIKIMKEWISFGLPLLPHSLSFWLKGGMDKILLTTYCGLATNGIYSMAMSLSSFYTLFNNSFNNAFIPYIQKKINNINPENELAEKQSIVKFYVKIISILIIITVLAILASWIAVTYILNKRYLPSFEFVPWIIISLFITSFYGIFVQFIYFKKKTIALGSITFACSLIHLLLSYLLISNYGDIGIKINIIISSTLTAILIIIFSNKIFPLPWSMLFSKKNNL